MAWTTPRTWVAGEVVTAALLNTHLRDNLNALKDLNPRARAIQSTLASITSGTITIVTFQSAFDNDSIWDVAVPTRLTCKTAGTYAIGGQFVIAANATGYREARILKNGAWTDFMDRQWGFAGAGAVLVPQALLVLAVNDYIQFDVFQNSGVSLNLNVQTYGWMSRVSA